MQHTYLFETGRWKVSGTLIDAEGGIASLRGHCTVVHESRHMTVSSLVEISDPALGGICREFTCPLPKPGAGPSGHELEWTASDTKFGELSGLFIVVGDSILSTGASEDNGLVISEWFMQVDTDRYVSRGLVLRNKIRDYSWAVELERLTS